MRPSPARTLGSESFTFRQMGDYVRIEINGGVLRAAERMASEEEYTYLTGAPELARFQEFLALVVEAFRKVQTNQDTVAYVFRYKNRWIRVEENKGALKFAARLDDDEEFVYLTGPELVDTELGFLNYATRQLDTNILGEPA